MSTKLTLGAFATVLLSLWTCSHATITSIAYPPSDVDLYLVPCDPTDKTQQWSFTDVPQSSATKLIQLIEKDPVDGSSVCLNCPKDRCHGWTCDSSDGNGLFKIHTLPDGNATIGASGKDSGWPDTSCLASLTGGINSKIEMQPCDSTNPEQKWMLDPQTNLLHNRAIPVSQAMNLCLMIDLSGEAPVRPTLNISTVTVDTEQVKPLDHFWSKCVGSSHGAMWNRADWLHHLQYSHELGGFEYVRGHGILDEDVMSYSTGQTYYNAIRAYANVLASGMKPVVELSYTPNPLASGTSTTFHYKGENTPPKDMKVYHQYIQDFVQALVDYFGVAEVSSWMFEVYNEPDLSNLGCQSVNVSTNSSDPSCKYFEMFAECSKAVKSVSPSLKIGGPATSQTRWLVDLAEYCVKNNVSIDFLSTHSYPSDPSNGRWPGSGRGSQADTSFQFINIAFAAKQAKALDIPLWITEWSSDPSSRSAYHDSTDTAAYIISSVASVRNLGLKAYSYWTFSDVFEEGGIPGKNTPFHGGFGMINLYDIPKPSMRAFQMLNMLSHMEAAVITPKIPGALTILASVTTGTNVTILIANHNCSTCTDPQPVMLEWISVAHFTQAKQVQLARIDSNNTNPKATWLRMNSPNYPTPTQQDVLADAAKLTFTTWPVITAPDGNPGLKSLLVPPHGVVCVVFS